MRPWPLVLFALALAACGAPSREPAPTSTSLASAVNEDGLAMVVCDTVISFSAPSPAAKGSLVLGRGGWTIAEDAELGHGELLVPDARVCAHLRFDEDQAIERCDVEPAPTEDPWPSDDESD